MDWDAANALAAWFGAAVAAFVFIESRWQRHQQRQETELSKLRLETSAAGPDAMILTVVYRPEKGHTRYRVSIETVDDKSLLSEPGWSSLSSNTFIAMPRRTADPNASQSRNASFDLQEEGAAGELRAHTTVVCHDRRSRIRVSIVDAATGTVVLKHTAALTV